MQILLVDDHKLFMEGLYALLNHEYADSKITMCNNITYAIAYLEANKVDVMIMDWVIPGNDMKAFLVACRSNYPNLKILVLSSTIDIKTVKYTISLGANAFLGKSVDFIEIKIGIQKALQNERYLSSDISSNMATFILDLEETKLTKKELKILQLIAEGYPVLKSAEKLNISPTTVMTHRRSIMKKLNLHSAAELVKYAYDNNLV